MQTMLAVTLLGILLNTAVANDCNFFPEHNIHILVSDKNEGLSEKQFNLVIDKVEAVYRPLIEELGFVLTVNRLWYDSRVNAGATKKGSEWIINMYGGFARHRSISEDGFALVLCHEFGHHIGGAPKKKASPEEPKWSTTEGQADYFATLKCLRKVFQKEDNQRIVSALKIPPIIKEKCSASFKSEEEILLCMRSSLAGIDVANISSDIRREPQPDLETPDTTVVTSTYAEHPKPQCRLDTYFQGAICEMSFLRPVSSVEEVRGTCHPNKGHTQGLRPSCWFKHNLPEFMEKR